MSSYDKMKVVNSRFRKSHGIYMVSSYSQTHVTDNMYIHIIGCIIILVKFLNYFISLNSESVLISVLYCSFPTICSNFI